MPLETKHGLGNPTRPSRRKGFINISSPFGEGQTDTPINQANQGEVQPTRRSIVTIGRRTEPVEVVRSLRDLIYSERHYFLGANLTLV
jgi:hypothetical protein